MTIIYTIIALTIGFALGHTVGHRMSYQKNSTFSKADARQGREVIAKRIEKRKSRIMEYAEKHGKIVNDDVEDLFCISDYTARNYLNELEAEGKLSQKGVGGGTYYEIA